MRVQSESPHTFWLVDLPSEAERICAYVTYGRNTINRECDHVVWRCAQASPIRRVRCNECS